jgi:hypothetical protein
MTMRMRFISANAESSSELVSRTNTPEPMILRSDTSHPSYRTNYEINSLISSRFSSQDRHQSSSSSHLFVQDPEHSSTDNTTLTPMFPRSLSSSEDRQGRPKQRVYVGEKERKHYHAHSREQSEQIEHIRKLTGKTISPISSPRSLSSSKTSACKS